MSKPLIPGHPKPSIEPDGNLDMGDVEIDNIKTLNMSSGTELTISAGAITATQGHHSVDTEADAATDDLDTINGLDNNDLLLLFAADGARTVRIRNGVGNIFLAHQIFNKSYSFASPSGSSGTFYAAGFLNWPTTDANLNETTPTNVTHGTANAPYGAHAGLVAGGAGSTDAGTVSIVISGTSVDDSNNRTAADSETLVADITAMSLNEFFTSAKKWVGTVTWTITGSGGAATFNADFNYGLCKYDDFGNQTLSITDLEIVGRAGASDTGANFRLFFYNTADWTYAATGFVPGPTAGDASELANMNTSYSTEQDLANGEHFSYKRDDLNQDIDGTAKEGFILEITTTANKAIETMDIHISGHTVPKYFFLAAATQHIQFMRHGSNVHQVG